MLDIPPVKLQHLELRHQGANVPLIDRTYLLPLDKPGPVSFFGLLSHDCAQLIFANTHITFLKARRAQFSLGVPFAAALDLELPTFDICSLLQNLSLFAMYTYNLSNLFLNCSLAKHYLDELLPNTTIHVINLDERQDRWQRVRKLPFRRFGIERFQAIRGRPGLGWEGCARSHMALVERAKKIGAPYVIVAEDDFGNMVDLAAWEERLWTILHWLMKNPEKWGVFNGHPCGQLVDSPISVLSRDLGILEMPGGLNTHFLVYNSRQYDRVLSWYLAYNPLLPQNAIKANVSQAELDETLPDLSSLPPTKVHLLAIDEWLSDHCTIVTALPLLTMSLHDDSDIIGGETLDGETVKKFRQDFDGWLSRIDPRLNSLNRHLPEMLPLLEPWKDTHTFKFYDAELKLADNPESRNRKQANAHFTNYSQVLHHFYDAWWFVDTGESLFGNVELHADSDVTVVCTSCGRWACLHETLSSFFRKNSYPVRAVLVAEDSGRQWMADKIRRHFPQVTLLFDGQCKGQDARVRELWAHAVTPFVFHMEDDWSFVHPFFIEKSRVLLENDASLLNVWLRDIDDTNLHPLEPELHSCGGLLYWKLSWGHNEVWNGFTWNPTLMRRSVVGPAIAAQSEALSHAALEREMSLSVHFRELGMTSAIFPGGSVVHTGYFSVASGENKGIFEEPGAPLD